MPSPTVKRRKLLSKPPVLPSLDYQFALDRTFGPHPTTATDCLIPARRGPAARFNRNSGATQVNAQGLIEWAPENLFIFSEQLNNNTTLTGLRAFGSGSVVDATVAPNGTMTAELIVEDLNFTNHQIVRGTTINTLVGGIYTASIYLKKKENSFALVGLTNGVAATFVSVNLTSGVVVGNIGSPANPLSFSSVDAGNGWWRVSLSVQATINAALVMDVRMSKDGLWANRSYQGDNTSGLYIWGAQLERSSTARTYIPTTSQPIYGPRFDYDPVTLEPRVLLLEESSVNLLQRSGQIGTSPWTADTSGGAATYTNTTAPDGTNTASVITGNTIGQAYTNTAGITYTISFFIKKGSAAVTRITFYDGSVYSLSNFRWSTLLLENNGGTLVYTYKVVPWNNGWYRLEITYTASVTSSLANIRIGVLTTEPTNTAIAWGAQLEAKAYATSYIPNVDASGGSTRSLEILQTDAAETYLRNSEATIVADFHKLPFATYTGLAAVHPTNVRSAGGIALEPNRFYTYNSTPAYSNFTIADGANHKIAGAYKAGDQVVCVNGAITSPISPNIYTAAQYGAVAIGRNGTIGGPQGSNAYWKSFRYYKKRLPNSKLQIISRILPSEYGMTDVDALDYVRAVDAARGFSMTLAQRNLLDVFYAAEKVSGRYFATHKRIYVPGWGSAAANSIDLITRSSGTFAGTVTHGPGYVQGDGSTGYFDTNATTTTTGWPAGSASIGVLVTQSDTRNNGYFGGYNSGASPRTILAQSGATTMFWQHPSVANAATSTILAPTGIILGNTNSTTYREIRVRKQSGSSVAASNSTLDITEPQAGQKLFFMCRNAVGNPANYTDARFGAFTLGLGFSSTDADAFSLNLKTLWEGLFGLTLP